MKEKLKDESLKFVKIDQCATLKRNPQYLTPHQMEALKESIKRDGFLAPVLLRPLKNNKYEIVSGNHRVMAAKEVGRDTIPAIIIDLDDRSAKRAALNMKTVHGNPSAELMAPFLAEMDDELLSSIHLDADLLKSINEFDIDLQKRLSLLQIPESIDHDSASSPLPNCVCHCGHRHVKKT